MGLEKSTSKQHKNVEDKNVVMISNSTVIVGCNGEVGLDSANHIVLAVREEEILRIYKGLPFRQQIEFLQKAIEFEDENVCSKDS